MAAAAMGANCGDGVGACSCGDTLTADYTMTGDLTGTGNCLTIGASDIYLDCNDAEIIGDGTGNGLYSPSNNNVYITSCNFQNFDRNIWLNGGENYTLDNLIIMNSADEGIRISGTDRVLINNSNATNNIRSFYSTGSHNISIYNSFSVGGEYGFYLEQTQDSIIDNCRVENNTNNKQGFLFNKVNRSVIKDSYAYNTSWNNFDIVGFSNHVYNNTGILTDHYIFDMCSSSSVLDTGYNIIEENIADGGGIYVCDGIYNNITNNEVSNSLSPTIGYGLAIEGNSSNTYGNKFYGNIVDNVRRFCMFSSANNTIFESNTVSNCNQSDVRIEPWFEKRDQINNDFFINNQFDSIARFVFKEENYNTSINETDYLSINLSNGGNVDLKRPQRKEFRVENDTITMLSGQLYTIYNGTSFYSQDGDNDVFTVNSNEQWYVYFGGLSLPIRAIRFFNGYLNELMRYMKLVRVNPTQSYVDKPIRLFKGNLSEFVSDYGITNQDIHNMSIRVYKVNYQGHCVDYDTSTIKCDPYPSRVIS